MTLATFHAFEWVRQQNTHTQIFHSSNVQQKKSRRERERDPGRKKEGGCFFRAQRKAPRCSTLDARRKKKKKRGNEKKMHVSSRITKRRNERLTNLKKNRVKVARAPSSSIRITRGNRRGFVLNEEEGEEGEERDGRESFWWRRGRSRANRK